MRRASAVAVALVLVLTGCGHIDDGIHVRDGDRPATAPPTPDTSGNVTD